MLVLESPSQLHQSIHKPWLILHHALHPHPVLLLVINSWSFSVSLLLRSDFSSRGTRASMDSRCQPELKCSGGRSGGTSLGPCRRHGWRAAVGVWASCPERGSAESPLRPLTVSTVQTHSLSGDKQKLMEEQRSGPPSCNLPSPCESHCLVLTIRWTSMSWHIPSSKEKCLIYKTPSPAFWEHFPIK